MVLRTATFPRAATILVACLLLCLTPVGASAELDSKKFDQPKTVTGFALKTHNKRTFSPETLKGQWSLVLLGYTHCPDICPFTLNNLALVVEELKIKMTPDSLPKVYFIGVDPDRDAEVLPDYVPNFDPDFVGVTGDWPEIKKLVEALEGFVRIDKKNKDDEGYLVRHSSRVSVINPDGKLVAQINPPLPPDDAARFIASLVIAHRKQSRIKVQKEPRS